MLVFSSSRKVILSVAGVWNQRSFKSLPTQTIQRFCDLARVYSCHLEHERSVTLGVVQPMLVVLQDTETILDIRDG